MKHRQHLAGITAASVVFFGASHLLGQLRFLSHVFDHNMPGNNIQLDPYSIEDLLELSSIYFGAFGILVYDPTINDFLLLDKNPRQRNWSSYKKLISSAQSLTNMLRNDFPERFRGPGSPELGKLSDFDVHGACHFSLLHVSLNIE
jgi:hypothetical protein